MAKRLVPFLAIVLTALSLVPGGAHLAAMANKLPLAQEDYFTVQQIYRGWSLFGVVLFSALAADLVLAVILRRRRGPFRLALAGFLLMVATLAIFFVWTYPANTATVNWTVAPAEWEALRTQWEYAHAVGAVLTFLALCAIVAAALSRGPNGKR